MPRATDLLAPVAVAVAGTVVGSAVAACGADEPGAPPAGSPRGPVERYVALGDSFTSGAGVGAALDGCNRTAAGYPRLVAAELGAELTDVSCAGARTRDAEAQLAAVDDGADLVTVGFGYNDGGFYTATMAGCARPGAACDPAQPARVGSHVAAVVAEVRDRAPDALVLVVGYPQPVPPASACPDLPMGPEDRAAARERLAALGDALAAAAAETGAGYVDVPAASAGHDVCAGPDAWVNGARPVPGRAAAYHPSARGHAAVAELVVEQVRAS